MVRPTKYLEKKKGGVEKVRNIIEGVNLWKVH
jgi:hypothetical protein